MDEMKKESDKTQAESATAGSSEGGQRVTNAIPVNAETKQEDHNISTGNDVQQSENSAELDFTADEAKTEEAAPELGREYDPRPIEDDARRKIAFSLIGLLWFVIVAMLIMLSFKTISVSDIKDFSVIFGPVVTLVSAATGFYYGTKSLK